MNIISEDSDKYCEKIAELLLPAVRIDYDGVTIVSENQKLLEQYLKSLVLSIKQELVSDFRKIF
jgi:hypothetical protein